jgi:hypothetical protein
MISRAATFSILGLLALTLPSAAIGDGALTIAVSAQVENFNQPLTVSGALSDASGGSVANVQVDLQATSTIAGADFKTVATGTTAADGSYSFTLTPSHNGQYRVVETSSPSIASSSVPVYRQVIFSTDCNWCRPVTLPRGPFRILIHYRILSPTDVRLGGKKLVVYFGRNAQRRQGIVGSRRVKQTAPGVAAGRVVLVAPAGTVSFDYYLCMRLSVNDRVGGPDASTPCPKTEPR